MTKNLETKRNELAKRFCFDLDEQHKDHAFDDYVEGFDACADIFLPLLKEMHMLLKLIEKHDNLNWASEIRKQLPEVESILGPTQEQEK